ncbi:winged helix-turn-helix domain-containing protein [Streptomyces sp. SID13031]|uniref:winged helix-turn-helix domain-containing protein n=1 Tax=Streptomyces sp. SID13031 TaxID=2706046 RepID=UPI0013C6E7CE|nr:winged helix-turn-helix domain-containing protein [Streptomyces sp. SID13031]NEA31269.1 winged helix-turn-helix transcriptional regulator [Streptomyces sp. SID13031]
MLRIHFTGQDLARTTLADEPDPLWELLLSLHQLQGRDGAGHYGRWRLRTRRQLPRPGERLLQLAPPSGYSPDFLTPAYAAGSFDAAVERVQSTSRQRIRHELELVRRPSSQWTKDLAEGRADAVNELGQALRTYHRYALAPYWESIRSLVRADLRRQTSHLYDAGIDGLLGKLHATTRWEAPVLEVMGLPDQDLYLEGRGLRLQASVFCWQFPTKLMDPRLTPVLVYPVHHSPSVRLETPIESRGESLSALLGSTRAVALEAIAETCNTTELARRCKISVAGASRQVSIMRDAGLISSRRAGQAVLHDLTDLGRALLDGPQHTAQSLES